MPSHVDIADSLNSLKKHPYPKQYLHLQTMAPAKKILLIILGIILALLAIFIVLPLVLVGSIWMILVLLVFAIITIPVFLAMMRSSRNAKKVAAEQENA